MIIVTPTAPSTRPPIGTGPALEAGDIWQVTSSGLRQRWSGSAWADYVPVIIRALAAPTQRPAPQGGGPVQPGDIWINNNSGAQATRDGTEWVVQYLPAGVVPPANWPRPINTVDERLEAFGVAEQHLAKASNAPYDTKWVVPAEGIVHLHQQQTPARVWDVSHDLRSRWVTVTCINSAGDTTMDPDIDYASENSCQLTFAEDVTGYAVVHASVLTPHWVV